MTMKLKDLVEHNPTKYLRWLIEKVIKMKEDSNDILEFYANSVLSMLSSLRHQ